MKLTAAQIDQLYTFTRQHYVEWYDLQSELVDHLANAIETQLEENPKLTFEEVLNKEFGKFGVFGFMGVVEEKQKFLDKKYRKLIWSYYKDFFRLPKIILTLFLIYTFYHFVQFFEETKATLFGLVIFSMLFFGFYLFKTDKNIEATRKSTGKKWLLENMAKNVNVYSLWVIPLQILNGIFLLKTFSGNENWQNWYSVPGSIFLVLAGLFHYILLKIIPKKVSEELAKTYPEYKFEKA